MPGRKFNSSEYRYGFNGKEKDDEGEFGSITNYDYGFRIYNPAVGRFLSVDPLSPNYPELTPYQFASNSPIGGVDLDGLEFLEKDQSLITLTSGGTYLKMANVSNPTHFRAQTAKIVSTKYSIGTTFDTRVSDGFSYLYRKIEIARNGYPGSGVRKDNYTTIKEVNVMTDSKTKGSNRKTKKMMKRLALNGHKPGDLVSTKTHTLPVSAKGKAGLAFIVGAVNDGLNLYGNNLVDSDRIKANEQAKSYVVLATEIVFDASENGVLKEEFNTDVYKSNLANYILQGEFYSNFDQATQVKLERQAILIILSDDRVGVNYENIESYEQVNEPEPTPTENKPETEN